MDANDKKLRLKATYRQLFKENRDFTSFHNVAIDSAYLNGTLSTRDLVCKMLCSDMYINYILSTNSNLRFVKLCFERVLGRTATQTETFQWSSLLASKGLEEFAENLTNCDEYDQAFGDHIVPYRRSERISSSAQGLPAFPKELSAKRYLGKGSTYQVPAEPIGNEMRRTIQWVVFLGAAGVLIILNLGLFS
ncbi:MAG: phycobilisome rod-core linker polypeptide [Chloroflexota bacterium]